MRSNSITEHFEKIIKDYMVTSFTGQKLDQTFGDQYWEFTDEGGLMKVLEAICDVAEDAIKDYEERIGNLNEAVQAAIHGGGYAADKFEAIAPPLGEPIPYIEPPAPPQIVDAPPIKKRAPRADKGKSRKKCVACEGSGKNTKGEDCPICKTTPIEATLDGQPPFEIVDAPTPLHEKAVEVLNAHVTQPTSTPPWLAQPAAPAFFPPPPPPPYWNPNA